MRTYVVWCPDLGQEQEDGATIPATDPADAAEGWAEWHDRSSAEYRIASGREEIVIVRDVETGEQREWIVRGEAMPYYTAQPGESATIRAQEGVGQPNSRPCGRSLRAPTQHSGTRRQSYRNTWRGTRWLSTSICMSNVAPRKPRRSGTR